MGHIFQRPFLGDLFVEGLTYSVKFALQDQLGQLIVGREIKKIVLPYHFCFVLICIWRGNLMQGFCVMSLRGGLYMEGLIFGILL